MDDVFVLLGVDEIVAMRPDMARADLAEARSKEADADEDWKPPAETKKAAGKAAMRALQERGGVTG